MVYGGLLAISPTPLTYLRQYVGENSIVFFTPSSGSIAMFIFATRLKAPRSFPRQARRNDKHQPAHGNTLVQSPTLWHGTNPCLRRISRPSYSKGESFNTGHNVVGDWRPSAVGGWFVNELHSLSLQFGALHRPILPGGRLVTVSTIFAK
jgi:hypothetical protein